MRSDITLQILKCGDFYKTIPGRGAKISPAWDYEKSPPFWTCSAHSAKTYS